MPKLKSYNEFCERLKRGDKFINIKSHASLVYELSPTNDLRMFGMKYDGMMMSSFYVFLMPTYLHIVFTFGTEIELQNILFTQIKFINE